MRALQQPFGRRGRESSSPAGPIGTTIAAPPQPSKLLALFRSGSTKRYLIGAAIVFVVGSKLISTVHQIYFLDYASDHAKQACAGETGFFDGPNSCYRCVQRVESGGKV